MSERPFKHIENKIRQAAENFQPAWQEQAWDRMEALLDQEKKKKRPVFWWWPFPVILLISVTILYLIISPSSVNKEAGKKNIPIHSAPVTMVSTDNLISLKPTIISPSPIVKMNEKEDEAIMNIHPVSSITNEGIKSAPTRLDKNNFIEAELEKKTTLKREKGTEVKDPSPPDDNSTQIGDYKQNQITKTEPPVTEIKKNEGLPENKAITFQKGGINTNKSSFLSKLYFTVTGGAEAPDLKSFSNSGSKISVKSGLGLGYQINDRFSVETGFYFGSKKYITGPENYKYPDDSYWNTVELLQVDANCFIYEIPLLLRYNFFQKKSLVLNVSGGLESFIMQKEDYVYDYLKNGTPYTSSRSYEGNSHFLSSIQFSIGLEKKLNQKFSFLVAPSISIPINGVGNGKVKLHSTSIQAGIKYFPFQKK